MGENKAIILLLKELGETNASIEELKKAIDVEEGTLERYKLKLARHESTAKTLNDAIKILKSYKE